MKFTSVPGSVWVGSYLLYRFCCLSLSTETARCPKCVVELSSRLVIKNTTRYFLGPLYVTLPNWLWHLWVSLWHWLWQFSHITNLKSYRMTPTTAKILLESIWANKLSIQSKSQSFSWRILSRINLLVVVPTINRTKDDFIRVSARWCDEYLPVFSAWDSDRWLTSNFLHTTLQRRSNADGSYTDEGNLIPTES